MKKVFFVIAFMAFFTVNAQKSTFTYSRVSGDTLHCKDCGSFRIMSLGRNLMVNEEISSIGHFNDSVQLIYVEYMKFAANAKSDYFYRVSFPSLKMECDLRKPRRIEEVYEEICKHQLINKHGLDTNAVATFEIIKGHVSAAELKGIKTKKDSVTEDRSVIMYRNLNAPLQIEKEDIVQDTVKIGSYETKTIDGLKGKMTQIQVFNSIGALICTATGSPDANGDWRLLTYRDGKFHSLNNAKLDFEGLLRYLIKHSYL